MNKKVLYLCVQVFCLIALTASLSCRKVEITRSPVDGNLREQFFNSHRSSSATEQAFNSFLQRTQEKQPFIDVTVSRIGYPRWDKMIRKTAKINQVRSGGQGSNSASPANSEIYFIPFVRDSENHVNAAMIITANPTDTTISYACDWQYGRLLMNDTLPNGKAEKFAVFFMKFDNAIFGHKSFNITDKRLFQTKDVTSPQNVIVRFSESSTQEAIKVNSFNVTCADVTTYTQDCPWLKRNEVCPSAPAGKSCDGCPQYCTKSRSLTVCWEEWIDDGGVPPIGGGYSGGGGGGGGPIPPDDPCDDDDPPPAPDAKNTRAGKVGLNSPPPTEPCEPGWELDPGLYPIPITPQNPPVPIKCDDLWFVAAQMDVLYEISKVDSVIATIPSFSTQLIEYGYIVTERFAINPNNRYDTSTLYFTAGALASGTDSSITVSFSGNPNYQGYASMVHTHPAKGLSAPSPADLFKLVDAKLYDRRHRGNFIVSATGEKFAITVVDTAQATAFNDSLSTFLSGRSWKAGSRIEAAYDDAFSYFKKNHPPNVTADNYAHEMAMAAVLNDFNSGIALLKQDSMGKFAPITVRTTMTTVRSRGKDRQMPIYLHDCQAR